MTTAIVMHDAHVCARVTFVAARTAMVQAAVTKRARAATRATTRATVRATTKVVRANAVAKKEAAEKHASIVGKWIARVQARAAAKAAAAPAVREANRTASMVVKVVKAANALRLAAIRVARMAAKVAPVIKATMVAIDKAYALHMAPCGTPVVAPATVNVYSIVAFLAMTPCIHALWFYATLHIAMYASDKEDAKTLAKDTNRAHARIKAPRARLNDAAKRAQITEMHKCARTTVLHVQAKTGTGISNAKVMARIAQGAAQKAANEARKAGMPAKVGVVHTPIVRSGPTKVRGVKREKVWHMAHTVESVAKVAADRAAAIAEDIAFKALMAKHKADALIAKAHRVAKRKAAFEARKEAMIQIVSDAWMNQGVWLDPEFVDAANDWSYEVRISAFKEARNIAYAKAPVAVAA